MQERSNLPPQDGRGPFWLGLLVAASVAFSLGFACATPLAAFAAAAACTLPRRDTYYFMAAVWLVNQGVGFAFLHYPWTPDCLAWGAGLGLAALLSTWAARWTVLCLSPLLHVFTRNTAAFVAAFTAYEAALLGLAFWLGGTQHFTLAIQARIFAMNALAWVGLLGLHRMGMVLGIASSLPGTRPPGGSA